MIKIYAVRADEIYERLGDVLTKLTGAPQTILRTAGGKPYIDGNPLFFSVSHSGDRGVFAISDKPVGIDLQLYSKREYAVVKKRLCEREKSEILTARDFTCHWTAREAFVKMRGLSVFKTFKNVAYYGGNIYFDGKKQPCGIKTFNFCYGAVSVCTERGE